MEYELYHYGRKGMKWYQNIFTKGKEASAARKKRKAEKAKLAEEKRKESIEEQKTRIRNSRSAEQVYKNAHLFNDKELTEIYNRLNTENNIKNLIPAKVNKGKKFVENTASTIKNVGTLVGNTTDMVNKFKAFGNLFSKNKSTSNAGSASKSTSQTKDKDGKTKDSKTKDTASKVFEGIVEGVANGSKSSSSDSGPKTKASTIIDAEWWGVSDNATSVARSLTKNVGSRTVNFVKNNPDRIESGASFVSGMLSLPAPKDD